MTKFDPTGHPTLPLLFPLLVEFLLHMINVTLALNQLASGFYHIFDVFLMWRSISHTDWLKEVLEIVLDDPLFHMVLSILLERKQLLTYFSFYFLKIKD